MKESHGNLLFNEQAHQNIGTWQSESESAFSPTQSMIVQHLNTWMTLQQLASVCVWDVKRGRFAW